MTNKWKMLFKTEHQDDLWCWFILSNLFSSSFMLFGIKTVSRAIPLLANREAKAPEYLTSMLVYTTGQIISFNIILQKSTGEIILHESYSAVLHKHKHHTDCTVQLFSRQPESSHAEDRWREKTGQNSIEGRGREGVGGWMGRGEIHNHNRLTPPALALYWSRKHRHKQIARQTNSGCLKVDPKIFTLSHLSWRPFIFWGQELMESAVFPVNEGTFRCRTTSTNVQHSKL